MYLLFMWLQLIGYGLGGLAWLGQVVSIRIPLLGILGVFLAMQGTIALSWWDVVCGRTKSTWDVSGTQYRE